MFAYPNDRPGNLSRTLHCSSIRAHRVQASVAVPMKVGLFSERPSLPPEKAIDGGAVLCRTTQARRVFIRGRADFWVTLCPALRICQEKCL